MPRKNAYALTLTPRVQQRLLDLLDVIKECACTAHSGPNLFGAVVSMKLLLTNKKLHKAVR